MQTQPSTPLAPGRSHLAKDVQINGSLIFKGELNFDGLIKGGHIDGSRLVLGENAEVEGNITANEVTIAGRVKGNANVSERCQLKATAELNGDLTTARLIIEEGATFIGMSRITPRGTGQPV